MKKIKFLRNQIEKTDALIAKNIQTRFKLVKQINDIKQKNGLRAFDRKRYKYLISKFKKRLLKNKNKNEQKQILLIYKFILNQSLKMIQK